MSAEKLIEEMAKVYEEARFLANETLGSMNEGEGKWYAKAFYEAGYRKASEVAREIIEEAEKIFMFTCSSLEAYTDWQNFKKKYTEGKQ